jgi:small conductance mechanosensitive channel
MPGLIDPSEITTLLAGISWQGIVKFSLILIAGFFVARYASQGSRQLLARFASKQQQHILSRVISYFIFILFFVAALEELGFQLTALIGAAGLLIVAIVYASRSALTNLVSGILLYIESPFKIGDSIAIGSFQGDVESIDLLSTKIRNLDGTLTRIPNDQTQTATIINYSHFPHRRYDGIVTIDFQSDVNKAVNILNQIVTQHPLSFKKLPSLVFVKEFNTLGIAIQFQVWGARDQYRELQTAMWQQIKLKFDEANIRLALTFARPMA